MSRRLWWLGALLMIGAWALPSTVWARGRRTVPNLREARTATAPTRDHVTIIGLTVHVATEHGVSVVTRRELDQWIARANEALRPHGLAVELRAKASMAGFTSITRARERRQLASIAEHDGTIHVFVTESLDPGLRHNRRRRVRGLHWRYHGLNPELRQREFVVVTHGAPQTTFAHEIGHLLGLRHSYGEKNIMCSCRNGSDTTFTTEQGFAMRQGAQRFHSRQRQAQRREHVQRARNLDRPRRRR